MTINVTGTLVDPMNVPESNITIRAIAMNNETTLFNSEASTTTDDLGAYDFELVDGEFMLEVNTTDEYKLTGVIRVTSGMINPSYTIPELLTNHLVP